MKKAILIKPKLLAKIKRISPAVYEYYINSPITRIAFADYGTPDIPMFMPKAVLTIIETSLKKNNIEHSELMKSFQAGWVFGHRDLFLIDDEESKDPLSSGISKRNLLNTAINYPFYDAETLINKDNFTIVEDFLCSTIIYKEAQFFEAWRIILKYHEDFNDLFVEAKATWKKNHPEDMGLFGYNASFN